jgi:hypothetical protein
MTVNPVAPDALCYSLSGREKGATGAFFSEYSAGQHVDPMPGVIEISLAIPDLAQIPGLRLT